MKKNSQEKINIKGMHCSSCVQKIQTQLIQIDGINKAEVHLKQEIAIVDWNSTTNPLALQQVIDVIHQLGYKTDTQASQVCEVSYKSNTPDQMNQVVSTSVKIKGMTCTTCAASIEKTVLSSSSIQKASVHFGLSSMQLDHNPKFNLSQLKQIVKSAGAYTIETEKRQYKIQTTADDLISLVSQIQNQLETKLQSKLIKVDIASGLTLEIEFIPTLISENKLHSSLIHILNSNETIQFAEKKKAKHTEKRIDLGSLRLITAITLSIPIFILTMLSSWLNIEAWLNTSSKQWIVFLLTTPVQFFSGYPFLIGAWRAGRHWQLNMSSLVALGTLSSYVYSTFLLIRNPQMTSYFESAALIITFVLIGRWIEDKAKHRTSQSIQKLLELQSKWARVIRNNEEHSIEIEDVKIGDHILVKPGERIPIDGKVIQGLSYIDQSMLTGEPYPIKINVGKLVFSSTINQEGILVIQANKTMDQSLIARMIKLVEKAQASKPNIQKLVDKISSIFVPIVMSVALATFIVWFTLLSSGLIVSDASPLEIALKNMVAVLIIACPCAMGLATPTVLTVAINLGAKNHIFIKNPQSLEILPLIDIIAFDKTGTLTKGKIQVERVITKFNVSEKKIIEQISQIEQYSNHPVAKAIIKKAKDWEIPIKTNQHIKENIQIINGLGILYQSPDEMIHIGNYKMMQKYNLNIPESLQIQINRQSNTTQSSVFIALKNNVCGVIQISDTLKPNALSCIEIIQKNKIKTALLTGDKTSVANHMRKMLNLDYVQSELLPQDKIQWIQQQQPKKKIAMIGDGTNDAPSLAQADVGICMASGTDIAIESSDITLMKSDLASIIDLLVLSKQTIRKIKSNLFWAFFYNSLAIPLAAVGLLNPIFSALAMSMSSVSVIVNALFLKHSFKRHQQHIS